MLFTRSFLLLTTFTCFALNASVKAVPIYQSKVYAPEAGFLLTESLSEYYENIVDQVMMDVSEDVLSYLPEKISRGDVQSRHQAQKSMERNVNFMRASLLASINPLVATDIPQISGLTTIQKEAMLSIVSEEGKKTYNVEQLEADLFESVAVLNKKISHQLALIVNAEQSSSILIRQASATPHRQDKSSTITVEWKLRQPFQINVIREEYNTQDTTEELDWLYRRFSSIETSFLEEFDDRVNEAVQLIMESLALDV